MVMWAAAAYFGIVFAAAFVLGAVRVLVVAPALGPLLAVALEVPLVLGLSWAVAGWVLRRWPVPPSQRLHMGGVAFVLLMAAEAGLALAFGQSWGEFLRGLGTPAGLLGLAGQIGFAIIPALRGRLGQASG